MTCSMPPLRPYSSTRITSRPVPLCLPRKRPPRPPSQRPVRSHTPWVDSAHRRIIQLSCRHPLPRLSLPSPTTGPPGFPDLIPAGPSLSLRMRVPEIAMRPSEDCPNARNSLMTDLVPPRTNPRMKHPPVCHVLFVPSIFVTLILRSATEVYAQATQVGPFRLAALLYRFHSEGSGQHHQEAQRRPGGQGGWTRIRKPQRRRERGPFLI